MRTATQSIVSIRMFGSRPIAFTPSAVNFKDIGAVLCSYRNYIHPQKQLSHGVHLKLDDAKLFWEISGSIARQVVDSAK
jgi:hypothetical protein